MAEVILAFGERLSKCWKMLMKPLPKTIETTVLMVCVVLIIGACVGIFVFAIASGGFITQENETIGLSIVGACVFGIVVIFLLLWANAVYAKRKQANATRKRSDAPPRDRSRTTSHNDPSFAEVPPESESPEERTPLSTESSASHEVASSSGDGSGSTDPVDGELENEPVTQVQAEIHNVNLPDASSESEQVACSPKETDEEVPSSADEQSSSKPVAEGDDQPRQKLDS